ncbi:MAG: flagellar hook-length control protein FliK [Deltaproteobacteria bacterium]|nr:flagellar hook-length control protein FliK [Deltaproteobacteria bacterium]
MKVTEQQNSIKNKLSQAVRAAMQLTPGAASAGGETDALLKEFSEVMDKIAAKLKDSAPKGKGNGFNDFGIGELEHLGVLKSKAPEVKAEPQPQGKNAEKESEPVKVVEVKANGAKGDDKKDSKAEGSKSEVKEVSNSKIEKKDEPSDKEVRELVKKGEEVLTAKQPAKVEVVSEKVAAATETEVEVAVEKPVVAVDAKPIVKAPESKLADTSSKAQEVKPNEVKPQAEVKPESTVREAKVEEAPVAELIPQIETPKAETNPAQVQAQSKLAAAFSAEFARIRADVSVISGSAEREMSVASASKHAAVEGASKVNTQVSPTSARSTPFGNEGSLMRSLENGAQTESPRAARPLTQAASLRTMEKVENALREAAKSRDGKTISLRLDPPELGSVKVDISMRDGNLHARIVAESPAVNQFLRDKAHDLQSSLRKLGLNADTVSVSVGNNDSGSASNQQAFSQQRTERETTGVMGNFGSVSVATGAQGRENVTAVEDHWIA